MQYVLFFSCELGASQHYSPIANNKMWARSVFLIQESTRRNVVFKTAWTQRQTDTLVGSERLLFLPQFEELPKPCISPFKYRLGCHKEPLYFILKSCRHRIMCSPTSYFRYQQQSIPKANLCLGLSIKHNWESAKLVIMKNLARSLILSLPLSLFLILQSKF